MDYELPEELRMLKETVRRFVDNEIIPIERDAYDGHQLKPDVRAALEAADHVVCVWDEPALVTRAKLDEQRRTKAAMDAGNGGASGGAGLV